jgi:hypothetical protein
VLIRLIELRDQIVLMNVLVVLFEIYENQTYVNIKDLFLFIKFVLLDENLVKSGLYDDVILLFIQKYKKSLSGLIGILLKELKDSELRREI